MAMLADEEVIKTPWHSWDSQDRILAALGTSLEGISDQEATARLAR